MQELITKALHQAGADITALLSENQDAIMADISAAVIRNEGDKPPKYKLAVGITLNPTGTECGVKCVISYGAKKKDESEASVSTNPALPGMEHDELAPAGKRAVASIAAALNGRVDRAVDGLAKAAGPGNSVTIEHAGRSVTIEGKK